MRGARGKRSGSVWASLVRVVSALASIASIASIAAAFPADAHAQAPVRIRVRGTGRIEARASRMDGEVLFHGALTDDAGRALSGETLAVRMKRESDPADARTAEGIRAATGCDSTAERPGRPTAYGVRVAGSADAPEVLVITDEDGRFCFRTKLDADRYVATVSWDGSALVEASELHVTFDTSRQALALRFDPAPRVVSLDAPRASFEVVALLDDDGAPRVAAGLPVSLASGTGETLATDTTDRAGRARFTVESSRLGPPGPGELRASFAGNPDVAFATQAIEIERRAQVTLRVPAADAGELTPRIPDDGIPLDVDVTSVAGPVDEGGVEARIGDVIVGAAPVERGVARVVVTFAAQGAEADVHLRYVPVSPWFEPLSETSVRLPIRGPGILAKAPVLVAGLAVLALFLFGRLTSSSRKTKPETPAPKNADPRDGKPRLDVLRQAAPGESGWRGRVLDAHDGTPIAAAGVWIERGSFEGQTTLAATSTDEHGHFEIDAPSPLIGNEQLGAEGRLHDRLLQPLPPPSELSIAIVSRRRALLARLVTWARRAGTPYDAKPEPTPGHVRRAAGDDLGTARWADAVERAAFGAGDIDAHAESDVERLAPLPPNVEPPRAQEAPPRDDGGLLPGSPGAQSPAKKRHP